MRIEKVKNYFVVAALGINKLGLKPGPTADEVKKVVSEVCSVPICEIENLRNRRFMVVMARHLAYKVYRENNDRVSLKEIGIAFGGYNHTSVIHGINKINDRIETNEEVREFYKTILDKLT